MALTLIDEAGAIAMRRTALILVLVTATAAAPVAAQTVTYGLHERDGAAPLGTIADGEDDTGLNAYFYPDDYDPQYGSDGKLADAADFAADYGCRPIWDGRYGQHVEACNR